MSNTQKLSATFGDSYNGNAWKWVDHLHRAVKRGDVRNQRRIVTRVFGEKFYAEFCIPATMSKYQKNDKRRAGRQVTRHFRQLERQIQSFNNATRS